MESHQLTREVIRAEVQLNQFTELSELYWDWA